MLWKDCILLILGDSWVVCTMFWGVYLSSTERPCFLLFSSTCLNSDLHLHVVFSFWFHSVLPLSAHLSGRVIFLEQSWSFHFLEWNPVVSAPACRGKHRSGPCLGKPFILFSSGFRLSPYLHPQVFVQIPLFQVFPGRHLGGRSPPPRSPVFSPSLL